MKWAGPWFWGWLCVAGLNLTAPVPAWAQPSATDPRLPLHLLRAYQVWRDELPPTLDPQQAEIVVLAPVERCNPPPNKAFGLFSVVPAPAATLAGCKVIEGFVRQPPVALPVRTTVSTQTLPSREVAQIVEGLSPAPERRYVVLLRWDWTQPRQFHWYFEEVVYDRQERRTVWHAARGYEVSDLRDFRARDETDTLVALLVHDMPRDLLRRGWARAEGPVPGSRWIEPAQIALWQSTDRAALAVASTYASSTPLSDLRDLQLRPAGVAEQAFVAPADPRQWRSMARNQSTPLLSQSTYALLELPPGDYEYRAGSRAAERFSVAAGEIKVLNISRGAFNATDAAFEDLAWWRDKMLAGRGRHAFLAEPPHRGTEGLQTFFTGAAGL